MMGEQRHCRVNKRRFAITPHFVDHISCHLVARGEVTAIHLVRSDPLEAPDVLRGIHRPDLVLRSRNIPAVVLDQIQDGELFECGHLERFRNLSFGDRGIPQ